MYLSVLTCHFIPFIKGRQLLACMSFNDIPKIEDADWYIDLAFSRAKKQSSMVKSEVRGPRLEKVKRG